MAAVNPGWALTGQSGCVGREIGRKVGDRRADFGQLGSGSPALEQCLESVDGGVDCGAIEVGSWSTEIDGGVEVIARGLDQVRHSALHPCFGASPGGLFGLVANCGELDQRFCRPAGGRRLRK